MTEVTGWVAPAATMVAAMMTAANLGARVTGWGFVLFAIGSVCWSIVAIDTGQSNLLWTNLFLTAVNAVGIWRWLGRQATYEDGGQAAAANSRTSANPDLLPIGSLAGKNLVDRSGEIIGSVVDGMIACGDNRLAYWVVSEGGVGGVGERLHAVDPGEFTLADDQLRCSFSAADLAARPVLEPASWPAAAAEAK